MVNIFKPRYNVLRYTEAVSLNLCLIPVPNLYGFLSKKIFFGKGITWIVFKPSIQNSTFYFVIALSPFKQIYVIKLSVN